MNLMEVILRFSAFAKTEKDPIQKIKYLHELRQNHLPGVSASVVTYILNCIGENGEVIQTDGVPMDFTMHNGVPIKPANYLLH